MLSEIIIRRVISVILSVFVNFFCTFILFLNFLTITIFEAYLPKEIGSFFHRNLCIAIIFYLIVICSDSFYGIYIFGINHKSIFFIWIIKPAGNECPVTSRRLKTATAFFNILSISPVVCRIILSRIRFYYNSYMPHDTVFNTNTNLNRSMILS